MKNFTIILTVLIVMAIETNAQIPNSGFENWVDSSGIEVPSDVWLTPNNLVAGTTYNPPVTKSSDHYPQNIGSYSIRLENDTSYVNTNYDPITSPQRYWRIAYGSAQTAPLGSNHYIGYFGPSFPITGHPSSFYGYYKFIPQNNDTLTIGVVLFQNGSAVASAFLYSTDTVSDWASFDLPISDYTIADSAQIWLMALKTEPQGNSILYVDNLSFDSLITTGVNTITNIKKVNLFPNPATDAVQVTGIDETATLILSDINGRLLFTKEITAGETVLVSSLPNGVYLAIIKSKGSTATEKLIIQR